MALSELPSFYTLGPLPVIDLGFTSLPTYYVIISLVSCLSILWFYKRTDARDLWPKHATDLSLILLIAGFLGARLTHILFEYPSYYIENPMAIFYIWQGGFVFYGGALLAYLCAFLYVKKQNLTFWLWHDTLAPVLAFAYASGRLACFLAGCCYGKVCDLPWGIALKQVDIHSGHITHVIRHPTQLYASFFEFGTLAFLLLLERKKLPKGSLFLTWLALHSCGRILMEAFRDDPRGPNLLGFSLSTIISLLILATSSFLLLKRTTKPH